jgi:hypothetical protein
MLTSASAFLERIKSESPVMEKPVRRIAILAMLGAFSAWSQTSPPVIDPASQTAIIDSLADNLDEMDGMVRKNLLSGSSKPVSFSGEALYRYIGTTYDQYPSWMMEDHVENKNSVASVRVAMVAAPHRNLRLWSKLAFNAALYGTNKPTKRGADSAYQVTPQTGYFDPHSENLYEDMCAGLTAAIGKATTTLKLGGVLWTEASPLTVWKGQNRLFGWDYVPYELEQSPAQYYEYATSKGERTGRAAWNKKPFQGFQWESQDLPGKMYFEATYANYEGYQKWQPYEPNVNNTNGLMYIGDAAGTTNFNSKGTGIGPTYRQVTVLRLARQELPLPGNQALPIQLGLNYVNYHTDNDFAKQWKSAFNWGGLSNANDADQVRTWGVRGTDTSYKSNFFLSHQVLSFDARQTVSGKINFLVDVGVSQVDTSFFRVDRSNKGSRTDRIHTSWYRNMADSATIANTDTFGVIAHRKSEWTPAVYLQASNLISATVGGPVDLGLQAIYAPKKFYSGTSFVMPVDFFFPYEANLVGAGKFAGTDGGTPYVSNEVGNNFTVKYTGVRNGHLRANIGYHTQIEEGSDLLFIPWRLNGTAFKYSQNESTTQYDGYGLTDDYLRGNYAYDGAGYQDKTPGTMRQIRRMGNDFFFYNNPNGSLRRNPYGPTPGLAGGIRNDFLSTFEDYALLKKEDTAAINLMIRDGDLPQSKKTTQNLSIDYGQDISPLWSGKNPLFLGFYGAVNGITSGGLPNPSDAKTYLSGYLLRFEPVFQVTHRFWLIGLIGQERWYSRYGVAVIDSTTGYAPSNDADWSKQSNWHRAPVDYTDRCYGIGFDAGLSARVELHTRLEYFTRHDDGISAEVTTAAGHNDYKAWLLHAETKMWF